MSGGREGLSCFLCWQFESNYMRRSFGEKLSERECEKAASIWFLWGYLCEWYFRVRNTNGQRKRVREKDTESKRPVCHFCIVFHFRVLVSCAGALQSPTHQYWMRVITLYSARAVSLSSNMLLLPTNKGHLPYYHLCFAALPLTQYPSVGLNVMCHGGWQNKGSIKL